MCEEHTDKFICQFCGKQFSRPCNLNTHSKTCVKNPNRISLHKRKEGGWTCSICGALFQTRAEHNTHKRLTHRNDKIISVNFILRKFINVLFVIKNGRLLLRVVLSMKNIVKKIQIDVKHLHILYLKT